MGFTWIDWVILGVIGFGIWRGIRAGFIHQAGHLVGLVLGFVLGIHLMEPVGRMLVGAFNLSDELAPLLGFVLVFVAVLLLVLMAASLVEQLLGAINLGAVNRLMGGVLGALEAVLFISLMLWATGLFNWPEHDTRSNAILVEPIEIVAGAAWAYSAELWPEINRLSRQLSDEFHGYRVTVGSVRSDAAA